MAEEIQYISKIKLPKGNTTEVYNIKDLEAQELLQTLFSEEIIIDCGGANIAQ